MSFCGECGNKITPESTFCQECGTKVDNSIIIDDISNEIDTQNEIEEPDTSSKQVLNYSQLESKTNFGSELSSIPSKIEPLTKYIKGYSYVLMLIYAATSIVLISRLKLFSLIMNSASYIWGFVLISSIIHIMVTIGVIALIFNFVRYLESNFEKSKKYFNGLFAIMIYQIFDSLSIESDLSLTVNFLNYIFGGFFIFLIFFLIPVIIVSILNSKHLEKNTLSLVDVPNNNKSIDKITKIPNYDQLVELKSMKKLHRTNTLNIVQLINHFIIIGIIGFGGIIALLTLIFGGFGDALPIILISAMLIFIMLWFIKGLNQYKKEVRFFYSVFIALEFLFGLFWMNEISESFSIVFIIPPVFQIYTLFIHKPTSDYFEL